MIIHSVCLTATESSHGVQASAHVGVSQDGTRTSFRIDWPDVPKQGQGVDPGTWVLKVLSAIVEDFDAHTLWDFKLTGVQDMKEEPRA